MSNTEIVAYADRLANSIVSSCKAFRGHPTFKSRTAIRSDLTELIGIHKLYVALNEYRIDANSPTLLAVTRATEAVDTLPVGNNYVR